MNSDTGRSKSRPSQKRMSRFVKMPTRRPSGSVIGMPENRNRFISSSASCSVAVGGNVTGSVIIPLWLRLTFCTSAAWSAIVRLRWMTPMPPWRAIAMAMRDSVTLSIAADTSGTANVMSAANVAAVSTLSGNVSEYPGMTTTSSKVSASKRSKSSSFLVTDGPPVGRGGRGRR